MEPLNKKRRLDSPGLEEVNIKRTFEPYIEDLTPWNFGGRVPTLTDTCIYFISKNLALYSSLESLPNELLEKIFDTLWRNQALNDSNLILFSNLNHLELARSAITDTGILKIAPKSNTTLQSLNLDGCNITDNSINALSKWCTNLTHLSVGDCNLLSSDTLATLIHASPNLTSLNLKGIALHKNLIEQLGTLKTLWKLQISNVSLDACKLIIKLNVLPVLKELSLQSEFYIIPLIQSCSQLRILDLSNCLHIQDSHVRTILLASKYLVSIYLSYLPNLTDATLLFLSTYESLTLKEIYLLGNRQLTIANIRFLVLSRKFQVFGGIIKIVILRNRSALQPIILNVDKFITLQDLLYKILSIVNIEDPLGNWQLNELRFRRIAYRKNGTKRPAELYKLSFYSSLIKELLGEKRQYFYLEQKKNGWDDGFLSSRSLELVEKKSDNIFLKLKYWNPEKQCPVDLGDIEVSCKLSLGDLKQLICDHYLPDLVPEKLLIVEEETTLRINFLLPNSSSLVSFGIIGGDILHVEEISSFHLNSLNQVIRSHTQEYLSSHNITISVEEGTDSFDNRKIYNSHLPNCPIRFELNVPGTISFNQLKQEIATVCEIDPKYIKLHTKVAPTIVVQGSNESLDEILGGNTWLVVRFDLEAFV